MLFRIHFLICSDSMTINFLWIMQTLMPFTLVVSEYRYHISFPRNLPFYKWCGTKVAHCTRRVNILKLDPTLPDCSDHSDPHCRDVDYSVSSGAILRMRQISLVVKKPAFCICGNKDADQLRSNCAADQRLCFRYMDSTIPLLSKSKIASL